MKRSNTTANISKEMFESTAHGNSLTKRERFDKYTSYLKELYDGRFEYDYESFSALTKPIEFVDLTTGKRYKQILSNHFRSLPRELRDYSKDQMLPREEIAFRLQETFKDSTLTYVVTEDTKLSGKLKTTCSVCGSEYNKRISDYRKQPHCSNCVKIQERRERETHYRELISEKYPNFEILELEWKGYAKTKVKLRENDVEFSRYLDSLLRNNSSSKATNASSLEERREAFRAKATEAHEGKYDYSIPLYLEGADDTRCTLDFYFNQRSVIPIYCPIHKSIFRQDAGNHSLGSGCKDCGTESVSKSLIRDVHEVIEEAKLVHNGFYVYDEKFLESYKGSTSDAYIYCPIHEKHFLQNVSHHLAGSGCPDCANVKRARYKVSQAELDLKEYLEGLGLEVLSTNYLDCMGGLELDLYIPSLRLAIEYNGYIYHHSSYDTDNEYFRTKAKPSDYHLNKYLLCKGDGINLIHVWDFEDLESWKDTLGRYVEDPSRYVIQFKNTLRVHNGLNCYGISVAEEII